MTKVTRDKKKIFSAGMALLLCVTIMLTGTFAWQSISQTAKNEAMGEMANPGGRLHDDFNGKNKDIYVENFNKSYEAEPIIVRVRLFEYMEIGAEAGTNLTGGTGRAVEVLTTNAAGEESQINAIDTWHIHKFNETDPPHDYWNWKMGGQTVYMPTFNKNKDSKEADINGTFEGLDGNVTIGTPYDDYFAQNVDNPGVPWQENDSLSGTAYYDADDDINDEGSNGAGGAAGVNHTAVSETHLAQPTIDGTVISMSEWITDKNKALGDYWVYDDDGWAYWANPLLGDTATGLLLDEINLNKTIKDKWYYSIWVESQMVTAEDVGNEDNPVGFYHIDASNYGDGTPSTEARELLDLLIDEIGVDTTATYATMAMSSYEDEVIEDETTIPTEGETTIPTEDETAIPTEDETADEDENESTEGGITTGGTTGSSTTTVPGTTGSSTTTVPGTTGSSTTTVPGTTGSSTTTVPGTTNPEISDPEISDPEISDPEISDPEISDPEISDPDTPDPEIPNSDTPGESTPEPVTTEPETTETETTETETTE